MQVLGIESSCDECAASVVVNGQLVAQAIASQIPIHLEYGGVVPELASRDHIRQIIRVIETCLESAKLRLADIDGIGVTYGPGLVGSLLVGICAAKTIAFANKIPLVGINHVEAHLHAIFLERPDWAYPHVGLVVSGGHTSLFRVDDVGQITTLGRTLDDAAGEAFDKVAKMLGLAYPGGVSIQQVGATGDPKAIAFPRPMPGKRLDSSFSGLKTAACVQIKKTGIPQGQALADFAASFQEAIVDTLVKKTILAAQEQHIPRILVAGGVAANQRLRKKLVDKARSLGMEVAFPAIELCTDNAAMVASLAEVYLSRGFDQKLDLDAQPGLQIG